MHIRLYLRSALLAALVLATTASCRSRDEASQPAGRTSSPAATAATAENSAAPRRATGQPDGPLIVVLGDSLTAGLGLASHEAYPALLQEYLRDKGLPYHVVNAGISGDTSAGGLSRLDWTLEGDVRILVVALGANDGLRGLPVTQLRSNLARIIEGAQSRGITVVLAGMEAPPNWGDEYTRAFHDVYPSLAREYKVALVPFLLEGVAGISRLNQRDGIHPNAEGDRIVADTIWSVLEPIAVQQAGRSEGSAGS
jgi:acyl-CoA thioesterase-1